MINLTDWIQYQRYLQYKIWFQQIYICGLSTYIFVVSADMNLWFKIIKKNFKVAYVFVTGDVKVTATITVEDSIKQILQ